MEHLHILSLYVENHQGVLSRIAGLFSGRGYNMESLTVGITNDPSISRMTIVCGGDDQIIEQIKKQLNRLIDVIKVIDLTDKQSINREMLLVKFEIHPKDRGEIFQVADVFRGKISDVGNESIVVELTGSPEKIDGFIDLIQEYKITEMVRSGLVAMERGSKTKKANNE